MDNFIDFGHALGRSEMKKLMAGSGGSGNVCYCYCGGTEKGRLGGYGCNNTGGDSWCDQQCSTYYSCPDLNGKCKCC